MNKPPKILEKLFSFYPMIQVLLILLSIPLLVKGYLMVSFCNFIITGYLLSPFIWFLIKRKYGPPKAISYFGSQNQHANLWLISYYLQLLYNSIRVFESLLTLIPNLYSQWLRLWGSKIGNNVIWTPIVYITDRGSLEIKDRVLIGNKSYLSAHIVKKRSPGRYLVYLKPITIEEDSIISFETVIPGGVIVKKNTITKPREILHPKDPRGYNAES